jgi:hypothetical protein
MSLCCSRQSDFALGGDVAKPRRTVAPLQGERSAFRGKLRAYAGLCDSALRGAKPLSGQPVSVWTSATPTIDGAMNATDGRFVGRQPPSG